MERWLTPLRLNDGWVVAGCVPWLFVLRGPYHFDDFVTPVADPASQSLAAWVTHLTHTLRPLAKLTYAIEASAGMGDSPWARRLVSVALLALAAVLLARLLKRLGADRAVAVAAACLWVAHPIQAEMVLSLAGRPALLATGLVLASLLAAVGDRLRLAAVLFACAVLSRETAIAAIVPLAVASLGGTKRPLVEHARRLEGLATVFLLGIAWLLVQPRYAALADFSFHGRLWGPSVVAQVSAIPVGLSLYLRPWALSIDHGELLPATVASPLFWLGIAFLAAATLGVIGALRARRRAVAVGLALMLAALVPTQTVIPKLDPLTERPFASALAGLLVLITAGLLARRQIPWRAKPAWLDRGRLFAVIAAALLAGWCSFGRGKLYVSDVDLWEAAARLSTSKARPHFNHALALRAENRYREAARAAARAAELDPFDPEMEALAQTLEPYLR